MYGSFTGKAAYTGKTGASYFELRPPQPIPIAGAIEPIRMDCERDLGLYEEPNVWMVYDR